MSSGGVFLQKFFFFFVGVVFLSFSLELGGIESH